MLNEVSQKMRDRFRIISHVWDLKIEQRSKRQHNGRVDPNKLEGGLGCRDLGVIGQGGSVHW